MKVRPDGDLTDGGDRRRKPRPAARDRYRVERNWERRYARLLPLIDISGIVIASALTILFRWRYSSGDLIAYAAISVVMVPLWILAVSFGRGYETRFLELGSDEFRRVGTALAAIIGIVGFICFGLSEKTVWGYVLVTLPLAAVLTLVGRGLGRSVLHHLRTQHRAQHRVLVVGSGESATNLIRLVRRQPAAGWNIVGVCLNRSTGRRRTDRPEGSGPELLGVPVVGVLEHIPDAIREAKATTLAIAGSSDIDPDVLRRLMWDLEGSSVHVLVASALTDVTGPRISVQPVASLPLLRVEEPDLSGARRLVKSSVDRLLALSLIILLSPVLIAIAVAIRVKSPGPAIFRQVRSGRKGRRFVMYKFRSMYVDAESRLDEVRALNKQPDSVLFKAENDPRITPIGRFLRGWSLDELPQLFNALNGTMSLVGPRPPLPREVDEYTDDAHRRLMVKPGITGVWQVSGRSDLPWDESVRLDLRYVENWSLAADFAIMWRTVFAVVRRSGAY